MTAKEHALLELLERTVPYLEAYWRIEPIADLYTLVETVKTATVVAVMEE